MERNALAIAQRLHEIAVPVFISLKEEINPARPVARSQLAAGKITFTQLRVLFAIEHGRDQIGKLARSARVAQPAMSKIVDHLIGRGLVRREPHPADRRQIKLNLTAKGAAMTQRVRRQAAEQYVAPIARLSAREQKKLTDGIAVMLKVIETTRKETT
jgi:DNA-binding MarR family transcriptional regulator